MGPRISVDSVSWGHLGLALLGNARRIRAGQLHLIAEEWRERYGPIFLDVTSEFTARDDLDVGCCNSGQMADV
jgi:hypothetical protein